jgi:surface polysaccharide O-acyltransferase-like enzyme
VDIGMGEEIMTEGRLERHKNLDVARALAILFMIMVHCLEYFATPRIMEHSVYGRVVEFLGSFTSATVFMFILGMGIHLTRDKSPIHFIRRGIVLLGAGYVLNVLRGFLPMLVIWGVTGDTEWVPYMIMELFWVDILQFAGMAFIFFGLMEHIKAKNSLYIVALIVFQILNFILLENSKYFTNLMNYKSFDYYLSAVTGLIWGSGEMSFFPFLTWIFYPVAGYIFGKYYFAAQPGKRSRGFLLGIGIAAIVGGSAYLFTRLVGIDFGWETDAAFYHHWLPGNLVFGACAFGLIAIVSLHYRRIPKAVRKLMMRWSKNITEIYFIQWIIIGAVSVVTDYNTMALPMVLVMTILVFVASDFLAMGFVKWDKLRI